MKSLYPGALCRDSSEVTRRSGFSARDKYSTVDPPVVTRLSHDRTVLAYLNLLDLVNTLSEFSLIIFS